MVHLNVFKQTNPMFTSQISKKLICKELKEISCRYVDIYSMLYLAKQSTIVNRMITQNLLPSKLYNIKFQWLYMYFKTQTLGQHISVLICQSKLRYMLRREIKPKVIVVTPSEISISFYLPWNLETVKAYEDFTLVFQNLA